MNDTARRATKKRTNRISKDVMTFLADTNHPWASWGMVVSRDIASLDFALWTYSLTGKATRVTQIPDSIKEGVLELSNLMTETSERGMWRAAVLQGAVHDGGVSLRSTFYYGQGANEWMLRGSEQATMHRRANPTPLPRAVASGDAPVSGKGPRR